MMSELDLLLNELDQAIEHVHQVAADIRSMFSGTSKEEVQEEEPIAFTNLRALCANKSRDGFTTQVRDLILATGAKKLSEVEPNQYKDLYQKVGKLG